MVKPGELGVPTGIPLRVRDDDGSGLLASDLGMGELSDDAKPFFPAVRGGIEGACDAAMSPVPARAVSTSTRRGTVPTWQPKTEVIRSGPETAEPPRSVREWRGRRRTPPRSGTNLLTLEKASDFERTRCIHDRTT